MEPAGARLKKPYSGIIIEMKTFELILVLVNAFAFAALVPPPVKRTGNSLRWLAYGMLAALVTALALQLLLEGARWQMAPAYAVAVGLVASWLNRLLLLKRVPAGKTLKRRTAIAGMALGLLVLATSVVLPVAFPAFRLPKPRGPYQIGTVTYQWTQDAPEIFSPALDQRRQLVAQIWYPAASSQSSARTPYVQNASAIGSTAGRSAGLPSFLFSHLSHVQTNAIPSAPVAADKPSYPVLIFLTGTSGFRQSNTVQIEHLVSNGYIVVGIDQPYTAAAVTLEGGQLISGWIRKDLRPLIDQSLKPGSTIPSVNGVELPEGIIPYLSRDVGFTLDQLARINRDDSLLAGRLDEERIGVFGISLGAMVAASACSSDLRLKACLMMDAAMPASVVESGLRQPAMWLTRPTSDMRKEGWPEAEIALAHDSMRAVFEKHAAQDAYFVQIPGMYHTNFTDAPLLTPLARPLGLAGPIDGERGLDIVNAYSLAFFNQYLGGPSGGLDSLAKQYPEVSLERR